MFIRVFEGYSVWGWVLFEELLLPSLLYPDFVDDVEELLPTLLLEEFCDGFEA